MTPEEIRTLTLFNSVESKPGINQRQLAQELDVSLGLANTYFKRVLKKGWVRAKRVKPRRWLYFLTPKGAIEKSRLSISYLNRTLESFRELKKKGDELIQILSDKGIKGVHLCGEDDLIEILSFCFSGIDIKLISVIPEISLIKKYTSNKALNLPKIKKGELIIIASLENQNLIANILEKKGFKKNGNWVLFT
tara:strand:+ start:582 stop:1160 length:579 start_codon:yes stop_codon:yes gene_type:complete